MDIVKKINSARDQSKLFEVAVQNIETWLNSKFLPSWVLASIEELVEKKEWGELNNRFYKNLELGTGGMRGRTIGEIVTRAEKGEPSEFGAPQHPAVGSAALNDFNIIRVTLGLYRYCRIFLKEKSSNNELPSIVIAHDVRYFSRHFCELVASTWVALGGRAEIFNGPRSTPQLSFSVRYLKATCGVVVTASHNPPHDNGYKIYFEDGAQVVTPHADGIINFFNDVKLDEISTYPDKNMERVVTLPDSLDHDYLDALEENVIDRDLLENNRPKVVFTPIHGTGSVISFPLMKRYGIEVISIEEQNKLDPRFPTVKSPNPENPEALRLAMEKAVEAGAELVLATDPDADRMGVAVAQSEGEMVLLSGNIIGALLADYRITKLKEMGLIPGNGSNQAALIKTFVTTPFQEAIAVSHGLKVINTLTGFKWIGEKLKFYEDQLVENIHETESVSLDYNSLTYHKRAELLLRYSTFYIFGGEESYGFLGTDGVRDKDANAAAIMFCELAAAIKKEGISIVEHLDRLYIKYGYYLEDLLNIYYEGASGAARIQRILNSYRSDPLKNIEGYEVVKFTDFGRQHIEDADGKVIPKQDFYMFELDNGYSYAVRGSGTEPKIKFYLFAKEEVEEPGKLDEIKKRAASSLIKIKRAIEKDAHLRAG